jgi:hypothetical protein
MVEWLGMETRTSVELDGDAIEELADWYRDHPYHEGMTIALAELNDGSVPFHIIAGLIERCM